MIPPQFIDEVIARTNLVELVQNHAHVQLTKRGRHWVGLCPFHLEKTPSFTVSAEKPVYNCFGCGKGGGAIDFVMEHEGLPFVDAVAFLAKEVGMVVPEQQYGDPNLRKKQEKILEMNTLAARFFYQCLHSPSGAEAMAYLVNRRLGKKVLTDFGLGFAPNQYDSLLRAMATKGYSGTELVEAGLAITSKKGNIIDKFRNRVMFPIINVKGEVIGFGGRVMDDGIPKYLNSPDTPVFNKSRNLFGLNLAKKSKLGYGILTEGYMDTIALHQGGFPCAVASLGTSLTEGHAQLMARYFKDSVISYDSDSAGVKATQRAIPLLEKAGLSVRVLQMEGAKDPDEYLKQYGSAAFGRLLDHSDNHIDYRLGQIAQKYNLEQPAHQVDFLQEASRYIATLDSPVKREVYGTKVAELAKVAREAVAAEVTNQLRYQNGRAKKEEQRRNLTPAAQLQPTQRNLRHDNIRCGRAEEGILRVVLQDPTLFPKVEDLSGHSFASPLLGRVFELLKWRLSQGLALSLPCLAGEVTPEEMNYLTSVVHEPQDLEQLEKALFDYVSVMIEELEKRSLQGDEAVLLAATKRLQERKAQRDNMEEK